MLKITLYVLLGLFFVGILSIMALSAGGLFGLLRFEDAAGKARALRKPLKRIWLAMLGIAILLIIFGRK